MFSLLLASWIHLGCRASGAGFRPGLLLLPLLLVNELAGRLCVNRTLRGHRGRTRASGPANLGAQSSWQTGCTLPVQFGSARFSLVWLVRLEPARLAAD